MDRLYWSDSHRKLYNGDCRDMSDLEDESVQMVVTSPPFWGLRKYSGLPDLIWGGDGSCEHTEMIPSPEPNVPKAGNKQRNYIQDGQYTGKHKWQHDDVKHDNLRFRGEHSVVGNEKNREIHPVHSWSENTFAIQGNNSMVRGKDETDSGNFAIPKFKGEPMKQSKVVAGQFCSLCGAWKGQLGLEPTPEMYIEHLVQIFREVRRVLRKDGVVFLNIGDSYSSGGRKTNKPQTVAGGNEQDLPLEYSPSRDMLEHPVLKPKDLCLIPFRLAIALQEDGWWVRSVIIWNKPNPMPESVTDRPTESHEYILMLTKSARYYWDQEAVREPLSPAAIERYQYDTGFHQKGGRGELYGFPQKRGFKSKHDTTFGEQEQHHGQDINSYPTGRNMRSVWTFPTHSYSGAHFATFPEKLVEICVKAATPEVGCCSKCGKPWERIIETSHRLEPKIGKGGIKRTGIISQLGISQHSALVTQELPIYQTLGWQPQCKCEAPTIPPTVLDPFAGSGTTLKVAAELNRRAIGYELSEQYCELVLERNRQSIMDRCYLLRR